MAVSQRASCRPARLSGVLEPPGVGCFAQAEAPNEARALKGDQKLVVGPGLDGDEAGIDAADGAAVAGDGALVVEVEFAVVADGPGGHGEGLGVERFAGKLPGEQGIA